jgi:ribosomal protein S18 acetylase RimI-like enzyme
MSCTIHTLAHCGFDALVEAFDKAFADYYLKMTQSSAAWLQQRMTKNGVDLGSSAGAFDRGQLVGFTLVGVEEDTRCAFDAGTGILPGYRGQGLAGRMIDLIVERLRPQGIERLLLEVLHPNLAAIRAYEKSGFRKVRSLDSYRLSRDRIQPRTLRDRAYTIERADKEQVLTLSDEMDWTPSWENSLRSLMRIPDEVVVIGAFNAGRCVGTLACYPTLNWIINLTVASDHRRQGIATVLVFRLWDYIAKDRKLIKLLNVDDSDHAMAAFLEQSGFERYVSQYEMELLIG